MHRPNFKVKQLCLLGHLPGSRSPGLIGLRLIDYHALEPKFVLAIKTKVLKQASSTSGIRP